MKRQQQMDRATMLELAWRDFFLWPLVRPAGILFEYVRTPLARAVWASVAIVAGRQREHLTAESLRREVFTLANIVSLYGLFLWMQLVYLAWAWWHAYASVRIFSLAGSVFNLSEPSAWTISIITVEIFLTDLVDGPSARVNGSVTALGTLLDHTRDYITAFTALIFLVILTVSSGQIFFIILLAGVIIGLLLVLAYHIKLMRLFARTRTTKTPRDMRELTAAKIIMIRTFALAEYQTKLTGRIQFGAMAVGIGFGLFYFATRSPALQILFGVSLVVSIMTTFYYLYELWGDYYEKWQLAMKGRSQHLKERLVNRIRNT